MSLLPAPGELPALLAMAFAAFLAATIVPAQSEAVFVGFLATRSADPVTLFLVASLANTAGSAVNWWLGRLVAEGGLERLPARLRPDPTRLARARARFAAFGWVALLASWLPLVGDPITLAAGLLRYPFGRFLALVALAKSARYAALWVGWATVAG